MIGKPLRVYRVKFNNNFLHSGIGYPRTDIWDPARVCALLRGAGAQYVPIEICPNHLWICIKCNNPYKGDYHRGNCVHGW